MSTNSETTEYNNDSSRPSVISLDHPEGSDDEGPDEIKELEVDSTQDVLAAQFVG